MLRKMVWGMCFLLPGMVTVNASSVTHDIDQKSKQQLTPAEQKSLSIAHNWSAANPKTGQPIRGADGAILFVYGLYQPSVICAVLQVCDIQFEAGESITAVNIGDTVRWSLDRVEAGSDEGVLQHLIVKPLDVGLETSLVVATDRRSYHIQLRSDPRQYMPKVSFLYPENINRKRSLAQAESQLQRLRKTLPETGEYLGDLDFNYRVKGDDALRPLRVYNDGRKTIIQMPSSLSQRDAPTLLILKKAGGLFSDDQTALVNYRIQGDRYIVDQVFNQAILIAGVGANQEKITITRKVS